MKIGLILLLALLPTLAVAQTSAAPSRDEIMAVVTREASAELARQTNLDAQARRSRHVVSGPFLAAAVRLDTPESRDYAARVAAQSTEAGTLALGDVYEALYAQDGQAQTLRPLRQRLDATLPDLARTSQRPPWGCEAVFLTPAVYARMSLLTSDPKYLQAMDTAWARMSWGWPVAHRRFACGGDTAMDLNEDGAVIAGLARILEVMPADFPARPRYVAQYQAMAAALITLKDAHDQWRPGLLDTAIYLPSQASGTAMATYALAFGLNHGLLDRDTYLPPVLRAWAGLNRDAGPDGRPGADTSGAFILAGLEVAGLNDPATPLPSPVIVHAADAPPPQTERPAAFAPSDTRQESQIYPATRAVATDPVTDDPSGRSPIPASPK